MPIGLIILAAGQGSRMRSDLPKVLHPVASAPLVIHALRSGEALNPERKVIVTGHGADLVEAAVRSYDDDVEFVRQDEQLGTAHAVDQARAAMDGFDGPAIVLYGDTPFIRPETLQDMVAKLNSGADVVVLGFETETPGRYGRLITSDAGLERIVEAKDATPEELTVTLCNSGVVAAQSTLMFDLIAKVGNDNAQGEYYLTDIPGLARDRGLSAQVVTCDEVETMGINTRVELARAEAAFQARAREEAMLNGVTLTDPGSVFFAYDTVIGRDAVIGPHVFFGPDVTIENDVTIRPMCHLEGCHVSRGSVVGPFARLRPGAELAEDTHIGNFVEIKNAQIAEGAKVNHLSYIGDAEIGAKTNIGAGTITCNYDGVMKHKTTIGERVFVGSNTMLVAPVTLGDDAMTASGSVITSNVPAGALSIARARQDNKPGLAIRLMERLRAIKAAKTKV